MLLSLQILIKAADREKEGINVTEAGERVYRAMLRVSCREGVPSNVKGELERGCTEQC